MIIDTSAVLAILFGDADTECYENAIAAAWPRRMSAVALLEAAMVVEGRGDAAAGQALDTFLEKASVEFVAVTAEHAIAARRAWRRFGKGNHPAALNFGDCFAYALAEATGEPLLFKGTDFARTDVAVALPPLEEGSPWSAVECVQGCRMCRRGAGDLNRFGSAPEELEFHLTGAPRVTGRQVLGKAATP